MKKLRPPAVPLMTIDPYFSIWSFDDTLYGDSTRHWSGIRNNILGLIQIDGNTYRFMGEAIPDKTYPDEIYPPIEQKDLTITPMQTVYTFANEAVELKLTFTVPFFTDDFDVMSRPVTYIDYSVFSVDGNEHDIMLAILPFCEIAVSSPEQKVKIIKRSDSHIAFGRGEEGLLGEEGDVCTCSWGWYELFAPGGTENLILKSSDFKYYDSWENKDDFENMNSENPYVVEACLGYCVGLKKEFRIDSRKCFGDFMAMGFDDIHSVEYMNMPIDAYYKRNGDSFADICRKSLDEHDDIIAGAVKRGEEIISQAKKVSDDYADIISLAYRQVIAGHKLTYVDGEIQFFSKECASNGCIGTVDVTYPSIPMFLLYNPELVKGMLNPIFRFCASGEWPFEFAPHDLGMYPVAGRQMYGDMRRETSWLPRPEFFKNPLNRNGYMWDRQMPIEESGNMIICVAAYCKAADDWSYAEKHFSLLKQWADYLLNNGFDPNNQLCTDDFCGHLAHNCNLSVKAIIAIACFGLISVKLGKNGDLYKKTSEAFAAEWKKEALDGKCYRLSFDAEDTWSLKYNLIWDKLFGFNLFGDDVIHKEIDFYETKLEKYGVPLDNRSDYGKTDWQMWISALVPGSEFEKKIISCIWSMINETQPRVPFTDWYYCRTSLKRGFQNRTVQGGLFINLIARDERFKDKQQLESS